MAKKRPSIPVNAMADELGMGIAIERLAIKDLLATGNSVANSVEEHNQFHRHDAHSFFLLQSGQVDIEIDFQQYTIMAPAVMYVHPNQVHHTITSHNVVVSTWAITNENLNAEYLKLLEDITPAKPLPLSPSTFLLLSEAVSVCLKFTGLKTDKLYYSLLKDSYNVLVALVLSQYLEQTTPAGTPLRYEAVTKAFREALERHYTTARRPASYAQQLHISTSYLNECVKRTTGHSVSYHIQQRIVLEAKRLLQHSGKSVKEIASALGYDDYPYFSRLFAKATGSTALSFRSKNLG